MTLSAYDILALLYKADKLSINYEVLIDENQNYVIKYQDGYEDIGYQQYPTYSTVAINSSSEDAKDSYNLYCGTYTYDEMMIRLNEMLEEEEQKKIKAQKRKELIESLTPEQRELLGFK